MTRVMKKFCTGMKYYTRIKSATSQIESGKR